MGGRREVLVKRPTETSGDQSLEWKDCKVSERQNMNNWKVESRHAMPLVLCHFPSTVLWVFFSLMIYLLTSLVCSVNMAIAVAVDAIQESGK